MGLATGWGEKTHHHPDTFGEALLMLCRGREHLPRVIDTSHHYAAASLTLFTECGLNGAKAPVAVLSIQLDWMGHWQGMPVVVYPIQRV